MGMTTDDRVSMVSAVKKLFEAIAAGRVHFVESAVPTAVKELKSVRFDDEGDPIYDSIGPSVKALARVFTASEQTSESIRRLKEHLGQPVPVSDQVLQDCSAKGSFSALSFELYKETVTVVSE